MILSTRISYDCGRGSLPQAAEEATGRLEEVLKGELPGWAQHAKERGLREVERMKERISMCEELEVGKYVERNVRTLCGQDTA